MEEEIILGEFHRGDYDGSTEKKRKRQRNIIIIEAGE